jgi:hypothetical protein
LVDLYENTKAPRTGSSGGSSPGGQKSFQTGRLRSPPVPQRKELANEEIPPFEFNTEQLAKSQQKANLNSIPFVSSRSNSSNNQIQTKSSQNNTSTTSDSKSNILLCFKKVSLF